jgi:hypothetical protein
MDLLDREKSPRGGGFTKEKETQELYPRNALVHSQKSEYWCGFLSTWDQVEKLQNEICLYSYYKFTN